MISLDCIQGSAEWEKARAGIPTASEFSRVFTPKGKLSAQRAEYMHQLLAEWVVGGPVDEFQGNYWTERGHEMEAEAFRLYQFDRELTPTAVGFCFRDEDRTVGCSPDWMVEDVGIAEVKAPKVATHVGFLLGGALPQKYAPQIQGQLWVTQREWCDFVSFAPGFPPLIVRVEPDAEWQDMLDEHLGTFIGELLAGRDSLRAMGVQPAMEGF